MNCDCRRFYNHSRLKLQCIIVMRMVKWINRLRHASIVCPHPDQGIIDFLPIDYNMDESAQRAGDYTDRKKRPSENNKTPGRNVWSIKRLMVVIRLTTTGSWASDWYSPYQRGPGVYLCWRREVTKEDNHSNNQWISGYPLWNSLW